MPKQNAKFFEKLHQDAKIKDEKRQKLVQHGEKVKLKKDLREMTDKPKISKAPSQMSYSRHDVALPIHERLLQEAE